MPIIKRKLNSKFTIVSNDMLNDPTMSLRAKGLMCYLLSKPPDWEVNVTHLYENAKEGKDAVYAIMKELGAKGYIVKENVMNGHLFNGVQYIVYDTPVPVTGKPEAINNSALSLREKPERDNPPIVSTELLKTERVKPDPSAILLKKKQDFMNTLGMWVASNPDKVYPLQMLIDFTRYWIETAKSGKPLIRYDQEKFFDMSKRLITWRKRISIDQLKDLQEQSARLGDLRTELIKLL